MSQRVTEDTSVREILILVQNAGHTTLVVDEVAVDHQLHEKYDIGINSRISIVPHGDEEAMKL
jgi:hypothetical protein